MLQKLIDDAKAVAEAAPALNASIDAVNADLSGDKINAKQLATDAAALAEAAGNFAADAEALAVDIQQLPQSKAPDEAQLKEFIDLAEQLLSEHKTIALNPAESSRACRLATLAVIGLSIAASFGLQIPPQVIALAQALQAQVCGVTPTPTPTP